MTTESPTPEEIAATQNDMVAKHIADQIYEALFHHRFLRTRENVRAVLTPLLRVYGDRRYCEARDAAAMVADGLFAEFGHHHFVRAGAASAADVIRKLTP